MTPELARVVALAQRRGACVRIVDDAAWAEAERRADGSWMHAPFGSFAFAIDEHQRVVYLHVSGVDHADAAGFVIHELGHLHATRRDRVSHTDEFSWMAWEIVVAREARVRRAWDRAMRDYSIGDDALLLAEVFTSDEWGDLTSRQRRAVIADRMRAARARGSIDANGRAVWRRLPKLKTA